MRMSGPVCWCAGCWQREVSRCCGAPWTSQAVSLHAADQPTPTSCTPGQQWCEEETVSVRSDLTIDRITPCLVSWNNETLKLLRPNEQSHRIASIAASKHNTRAICLIVNCESCLPCLSPLCSDWLLQQQQQGDGVCLLLFTFCSEGQQSSAV